MVTSMSAASILLIPGLATCIDNTRSILANQNIAISNGIGLDVRPYAVSKSGTEMPALLLSCQWNSFQPCCVGEHDVPQTPSHPCRQRASEMQLTYDVR